MDKRRAAEEYIYKWIGELLPGSENVKVYKELFAKMSDAQFDDLMHKLDRGDVILFLIAPNLSEHKVTIERNFAVAEKLKHNFFERLWLTDPATGVTYLTPVPYLVFDWPLRRQQQMRVEKQSIPENNRVIDELTGQPTGESHSSSLTFPELQVMYAQGLDAAPEEIIKFRGGDIKAFQRFNRSIVETGGASLSAIKAVEPSRVKSTETLSTLLTAAHLKNNL